MPKTNIERTKRWSKKPPKTAAERVKEHRQRIKEARSALYSKSFDNLIAHRKCAKKFFDNPFEKDEMQSNANKLLAVTAINKKKWQQLALRAAATEFEELAEKVAPLHSLQVEIESSATAPVALIPQTLECIKSELILDDELSVATAHSHKANPAILGRAGDLPVGASTAKNGGKPKRCPEVSIETQQSQASCYGGFKCELCPRLFTMKGNMILHMTTHDNLRPKFSCPCCAKVCCSKGTLMLHMKTHNGYLCKDAITGSQERAVVVADKQINRANIGATNDERTSRTQQLTFGAQASNDATVHTKNKFSLHEKLRDEAMSSDSARGSRTGQGMSVSKAVRQTTNYATAHPKTEVMSDEESLDGEHAANLEKNVSSHTTHPKEQFSSHSCVAHCKKTLSCKLCPKSFKTRGNLNTHLKTHHKRRIGQYDCHSCSKHKCQECGTHFTKKRFLKNHMLRKHPEASQTVILNSYFSTVASVQPSTFAISDEDSTQASQHIADEQNAACLLSEKTTPASGTYNCQVCEARFAQLGSLKMHMLFQHSVEKTQSILPDLQKPSADSMDIKEECISDEEFMVGEDGEDVQFARIYSEQRPNRSRSRGLP